MAMDVLDLLRRLEAETRSTTQGAPTNTLPGAVTQPLGALRSFLPFQTPDAPLDPGTPGTWTPPIGPPISVPPVLQALGALLEASPEVAKAGSGVAYAPYFQQLAALEQARSEIGRPGVPLSPTSGLIPPSAADVGLPAFLRRAQEGGLEHAIHGAQHDWETAPAPGVTKFILQQTLDPLNWIPAAQGKPLVGPAAEAATALMKAPVDLAGAGLGFVGRHLPFDLGGAADSAKIAAQRGFESDLLRNLGAKLQAAGIDLPASGPAGVLTEQRPAPPDVLAATQRAEAQAQETLRGVPWANEDRLAGRPVTSANPDLNYYNNRAQQDHNAIKDAIALTGDEVPKGVPLDITGTLRKLDPEDQSATWLNDALQYIRSDGVPRSVAEGPTPRTKVSHIDPATLTFEPDTSGHIKFAVDVLQDAKVIPPGEKARAATVLRWLQDARYGGDFPAPPPGEQRMWAAIQRQIEGAPEPVATGPQPPLPGPVGDTAAPTPPPVAGAGEDLAYPTSSTTMARGMTTGRDYQFQYEVVPLDSLQTSHTDALTPNPAYPAGYQPRDRTRAASGDQIQEIVNRFQPAEMLADSGVLYRGPQLVSPENVVESGNGRTLVLRRLRDQYPDQWNAYQQELQRRLPEYGLPPDATAGITDPVVIRRRVSDLAPDAHRAYIDEANAKPVLEMSPTERAQADATTLPSTLLAALNSGSGDLTTQLNSASNRPALRQWLSGLPATDRGALVDANGALNQAGAQRLAGALFARTFQGPAGERLTAAFRESLDPNLTNIRRALEDSTLDLARLKGTGYDVGDDLAAAVDVLARLRQEHIGVPDYLAQGAMFERELSPFQEQLLQFLDTNVRSVKNLRETFQSYARSALQPALADAPANKGELLNAAAAGHSAQAGLFDFTASDTAPSAAAAPESPQLDRGPAGRGQPLPPAEQPVLPGAADLAAPLPLTPVEVAEQKTLLRRPMSTWSEADWARHAELRDRATAAQQAAAEIPRRPPDAAPAPVPDVGAPPGSAPAAGAAPDATATSTIEGTLPRGLQGAKPRYGYGSNQYGVTFESDVDKALYIVAQAKPSKADSAYMGFLQSLRPDLDPNAIRSLGGELRGQIKAQAKADAGASDTLRVTRSGLLDDVAAETPPVPPVGAASSEGVDPLTGQPWSVLREQAARGSPVPAGIEQELADARTAQGIVRDEARTPGLGVDVNEQIAAGQRVQQASTAYQDALNSAMPPPQPGVDPAIMEKLAARDLAVQELTQPERMADVKDMQARYTPLTPKYEADLAAAKDLAQRLGVPQASSMAEVVKVARRGSDTALAAQAKALQNRWAGDLLRDDPTDVLVAEGIRGYAADRGLKMEGATWGPKVWKELTTAWRQQALFSPRYHVMNIADSMIKSLLMMGGPGFTEGARPWMPRELGGMIREAWTASGQGRDVADSAVVKTWQAFLDREHPGIHLELPSTVMSGGLAHESTQARGLEGIPGVGRLVRANLELGRAVEESARAAAFMQTFDESMKAGALERDAYQAGIDKAKQLFFDYEDVTNLDKVLSNVTAFHLFATRNLAFYAPILATHPAFLRALTAYDDATNQQAKAGGYGKARRLAESVSIPMMGGLGGQIAEHLFGTQGEVFWNPMSYLSIGEQTMTTPQEYRDEPPVGKALGRLSSVGVGPAPWLQVPLQIAGAYGAKGPSSLTRFDTPISATLGTILGRPVEMPWQTLQAARAVPPGMENLGFSDRVPNSPDMLVRMRLAQMSLERNPQFALQSPAQPIAPEYIQAMREGSKNPLFREANAQVQQQRLAEYGASFLGVPLAFQTEGNKWIAQATAAMPEGLDPKAQARYRQGQGVLGNAYNEAFQRNFDERGGNPDQAPMSRAAFAVQEWQHASPARRQAMMADPPTALLIAQYLGRQMPGGGRSAIDRIATGR